MNWKVFNNNGFPQIKCSAAAAAEVIGGALGLMSTGWELDAQQREARKSREWQSLENEKQRQWEEQQKIVERQYNTPAAQMARYEEAGLNPFLMSQNGQVQSGQTQAPSAPPLAGAPNMAQIPHFDTSFLGRAAGIYLQEKAIDADSANQRAHAENEVIHNSIEIRKYFGEDSAKKYYNSRMSELSGASIDHSVGWQNIMNEYEITQANREIAFVESSIQQKYGEDKAKQALSNMQAEYDKMQSEYHVNEELQKLYQLEQDYTKAKTDSERKEIEVKQAKIKELLASAADHYSSAVAHKASARLSVADAVIKEDAKDYLVGKLKADFAVSAFNASDRLADYESDTHVRAWKQSKTGKEFNEFRYFMDNNPVSSGAQSVLGTIGSIIKGR